MTNKQLSFIDRFPILIIAALNLPEGAEPLWDGEPLPKLPVSFFHCSTISLSSKMHPLYAQVHSRLHASAI